MDLYERLRHERRQQQERIARRYRIGALFVVALLAIFLAILALHRMSKACGVDLFGWDAYRRCSLPEVWIWLLSDAGVNWVLGATIVLGIAALVAFFDDGDG